MIELRHSQKAKSSSVIPMEMFYGGDTINTAVYLSRAGVSVSYVTALGDDCTSAWMLDEWAKEGIDCSLVQRMANSSPGLYMIQVDQDGERSFTYWRKCSPASQLLDDESNLDHLRESIGKFGYLYLSGISLAILSELSRERLFSLLESYKAQGGKIIFDGNYRAKLWSDIVSTRNMYRRIYRMAEIALPTLEDEMELFGYHSGVEVLEAVAGFGVPEIVVKMGDKGCLSLCDATRSELNIESLEPIDTTAAGDSFNAGYLSARIEGKGAIAACESGQRLAAKVIMHKGAIMPRGLI